ncbi:MAG: hypothetical protein ACTSR8_22705, partial [Promethearchaeota archaeon]
MNRKIISKEIIIIFIFSTIFFISSQLLINDANFQSKNSDEKINQSTIIKNLDPSTYSESLNKEAHNVNLSLHESYYTQGNSIIRFVNTSDSNNNTFTAPAPKVSGFNSTFTNFTISNIKAENKTLTLEPSGALTYDLDNLNYTLSSFIV